MSTDTTKRQEQLAKALRENLLRRKTQQRARTEELPPQQQGKNLMPDARPLTPERPSHDRDE